MHSTTRPETSSLSLGVAGLSDHGDTRLQLIQSADAALYRAKLPAGTGDGAEYAGEITPIDLPTPLPVHWSRLSLAAIPCWAYSLPGRSIGLQPLIRSIAPGRGNQVDNFASNPQFLSPVGEG